MAKLNPEKVDTIVIHITVSDYGDVETVNKWHLQRGWAGIGYHFLITNCFPTHERWERKQPDPASDGVVHIGRAIDTVGAHVQGHNSHSVGVALVGKNGDFTAKQLESAVKLCHELKKKFPNVKHILGHYELFDGKTCPDLDMDLFREMVQESE